MDAFEQRGKRDKREPNNQGRQNHTQSRSFSLRINAQGENYSHFSQPRQTPSGNDRKVTAHVTSTPQTPHVCRHKCQRVCDHALRPLAFGPPCRPRLHRGSYVDRSQVCWMRLNPRGCYVILPQSSISLLLILSPPAKTMGQIGCEICPFTRNYIAPNVLWSK